MKDDFSGAQVTGGEVTEKIIRWDFSDGSTLVELREWPPQDGRSLTLDEAMKNLKAAIEKQGNLSPSLDI